MSHSPERRPRDDDRSLGMGADVASRTSTRGKQRRLVLGSSIVAVLAAGAVAGTLVLSGSSQENEPLGVVETQTVAPASPSPTATASRVFEPFDRPEYVQITGLAEATGMVEPTTVAVSAQPSGTVLPEGMTGISFETDVMTDPRFEPGASTFVEQLRKLHKPVIRFGGQAVDRRFFWTSQDEPVPNWTLVPGYKGDVRPIQKVTPADLERLNRMAEAVDARILLTADLGHFDPQRAGDLAKHASDIFGDRLLGITVGNEPNGFHFVGRPYQILRPADWASDKFLKEYEQYSAAITTSAPGVKIVGPGVFAENWLQAFVEHDDPAVGALSYHHYPSSDCGTGDEGSPTIARVMSRERAEHNRAYSRSMVSTAQPGGLPVWITEAGVSACSGSNEMTRTHASALWTVNYALAAAQEGVTMLGIHGAIDACKGGPPASPICDTGAFKKPNGIIAGQANFYGMMLVNSVQPGEFVKAEQSGSDGIYSYAVKHRDGSMSVIVVNQNDPRLYGQAPVTVKLPAAAGTGTMSQMTAPSFDAQAQTRIDGREDSGAPLDERARIPGFVAGQDTVSLPLTSGTATVFNFTF